MTSSELKDRIESWVKQFENFPILGSCASGLLHGSAHDGRSWDEHMLAEIETMEIIEEIKGTPVEDQLLHAVCLAKKHDIYQLPVVYVALLQVKEYLELSIQVRERQAS